jgi:3D (Asp-Asp-Asp) domain-containing protein
MEDIYSSELTLHIDSDDAEVQVKGYKNMGDSGANWIRVILGGFMITAFMPSPAGVDRVLEGFKESSVEDEARVTVPKPEFFMEIPVEITSYNADPAQTDSTPEITASGKRVHETYCALSRDIEKEYGLKFGDRVDIEGYGIFEFQDRMNKRIKRGVDIFRWSRQEALEIGRRKGVIRVVPRTDRAREASNTHGMVNKKG